MVSNYFGDSMRRFSCGLMGLLIGCLGQLITPAMAEDASVIRITAEDQQRDQREEEYKTASDRLDKLRRAQIDYFHDHGAFGETAKEISFSHQPTLGEDTSNYRYQIILHPKSPKKVMMVGIPKHSQIPMVVVVLSGRREAIYNYESPTKEDSYQHYRTFINGASCSNIKPQSTAPAWSTVVHERNNRTGKALLGLECPRGFEKKGTIRVGSAL
jgi:hypothetical protein